MSLDDSVNSYSESLQRQAEFNEQGDVEKGNACVVEAYKALAEVFSYGDIGRAEIAKLFRHKCRNVRINAAGCMLRYRTDEARQVLLKESRLRGLDAVTASWVLKRWDDESWCYEPANTENSNE